MTEEVKGELKGAFHRGGTVRQASSGKEEAEISNRSAKEDVCPRLPPLLRFLQRPGCTKSNLTSRPIAPLFPASKIPFRGSSHENRTLLRTCTIREIRRIAWEGRAECLIISTKAKSSDDLNRVRKVASTLEDV